MEDGKWFSDWTEETKQGIAFTGSKLGIVPSGDGETLAIAYCDADGVKQVTQIGHANVPCAYTATSRCSPQTTSRPAMWF